MLLKPIIASLVTFFVVLNASADQKGLSFLNQPAAPQSQIEWFVDSQQGSQWSFNIKGVAQQLIGKNPGLELTNYRARVVDRENGQAILGWQGPNNTRYSANDNVYFLLNTGDAQLISRLQNPSDTLDLEISYQLVKGGTVQKNILYKVALTEYCTQLQDHVTQAFTGENGCFHPVTDNALSGRCTAAEQDTFCNSAFSDNRAGIEKRLGCELSCK
jgi:hypothetical protein